MSQGHVLILVLSLTVMVSSQAHLDKASLRARQAYRQISRIEPLPANATPGTKSRFQEMLTTVSQACAQVLQWTTGMSVVADCEDNIGLDTWNDFLSDDCEDQDSDDEDEGQDGDDPADIIEGGIEQLLTGLSEWLDEPEDNRRQYSIVHFSRMVDRGGYLGSVHAQELESLRHMIFGYHLTSKGHMERIFKDRNLSPSTVSQTAQSALDIEDVPDVHTRLLQRETLVFGGPKKDRVSGYFLGSLGTSPGSSLTKNGDNRIQRPTRPSFDNLRALCPPGEFAQIDRQTDIPPKLKTSRYNKLVSPVRKKFNKVMARRKQFLDAYVQFGPTILLDIVFCQTTKQGYPRESKQFAETWKSLLEAVEVHEIAQSRYGSDRKLTLRILEALGGEEITEYVKNFLDKHLYWDWDFESDSEESDGSDDPVGSDGE
ncbi:hypothetical protein BT96DRAFT_1004939 [Gymnopus androsaceus JB14]|uniref:Uncharacterized protein n=1 Tax=Gymnopus androsaceus JB14 TaxID=1447944 RepID=A0A6A4GPB6_9AGAR|nr:hypothetical protein BT96DRAFT_1004939 [Gymnopus androsaceus JB14]